MPKYYVAGIPFDSEDCLKHYGVKGMKWNQHIFGIDANDKYINWLKDTGQNIGKFANKAANAVGNAATSAARAAGGALNKSANFVTGNQARQNLNNAKANVSNVQSGRSKVNDAYARYDQLKGSEAQHRRTADGWRDSLSKRAPLENFGRNQDRINADNEDRRANRDANRAEIAKMKADRMAERQRNAETQARAEAKNAQQAYDRTLPGAAENAARGAQGFLNSAGKWVSTAANDVGNSAKQAGQWIGDTAQKAWESPLVNPEKAVNVAGQWIGDRANDLGKAATNAYNDVSKAVSGNGVEADVSERIAKKYGLNSVEDVLAMDRATAEKMLQEYDAEVSKAKDNSLFGRISNASNAVGNWVGDRAKDVGNVATDAWNGVTDSANQAGDWIGDRARDVGNVATDAWNGVSDAANQAGQWIGDRANDVGKAAGSAVNAVGNAANDAGQWIGDRARDVGNWFTGGDKGQQAADLREQAKALQERGDAMADQGVRGISDSIYAEPPVTMSPDNSAYAQSAKDNSEAMYQKGLSTRNQGYDLQDDAYALRNQAAHLQSAYDAAPRQQLRAGAEAVGNAASNAAKAIGNAANSAVNWVGDRASDIGDTVLQRARQQAADDHSQAVRNAYERVAEKYGMDLNKHPVLWDKNAYSELERELKQAYSDYSKRLEDIEKHPVGNAVGSLFHSELDNRPEGVGEAFWQNYIAHGGTREDYERDWR